MEHENKRELLRKVLDKGKAERVPLGFWWHFLSGEDLVSAYQQDEIVERVIKGHKKMYDDFRPDFMKIMSDGFFAHPSLVKKRDFSIEELGKIRSIDKRHPWITKQVEMVREISAYAQADIMTFYNIFSPLQAIRLSMKYAGAEPEAFQELMMDHPQEMVKISKVIAEDYKSLAEELKKNTSIDGIYYSVQNIQHPRANRRHHENYVMPVELDLLNYINSLWEYNILHICGYDHFHNEISYYGDYRAKAYNWAIHTDKVSLKEGKDFFKACVIGGFDNNKGSLLDSGSKEEIRIFVEQLVEETGREGLILGADCTIPADIEIERLRYLRKIAR